MKRTAVALVLLLAATAATVTDAGEDLDEIRPNVRRIERMAERGAERFESCCRGQSFDRARVRSAARSIERRLFRARARQHRSTGRLQRY